MRIMALPAFFLLATAVAVSAADMPQAPSSVAVPAASMTSDSFAFEDAAIVTHKTRSELSRKGDGPTENFNDAVCATMRTYVVARERRDSDATRVVGYSRCQPAWKFQLRTADQKVQERPR